LNGGTVFADRVSVMTPLPCGKIPQIARTALFAKFAAFGQFSQDCARRRLRYAK
jgi:hypothetical protein